MAARTETLHRTIRFGLGRRAGWAAIPVALAAVFAVAPWLDAGTTAGPAGGSVGVVAGDVATVGGPAVPAPGSDVHPIRFARIRVAGTTAAGRRIVRWLSAGRDGRFRLRLPPGRYTFT